MTRQAATISILIGFIVLSGSRQSRHQFQTALEDGVQIAVNSGGPLYSSDPFRYELQVSLSEDPLIPESLLFRPGDIAIGENGRYFICDEGNHRVAVFSSTGKYIRSIGRDGMGPGEFNRMSLQSLRAGLLSIFDVPQQRTTVFHTDGSLAEVFRLSQGRPVFALEKLPDGTLLAQQSHISVNSSAIGSEILLVTRYTADGRDLLMSVQCDEVETNAGAITGTNSISVFEIPFCAHPSAVYSPDHGILLTSGVSPDLLWYDLTGSLRRVMKLGLGPVQVTSSMKREYGRELADRNKAEVPDHLYPDQAGFWRKAIVDDYGFTWLTAVAEAGNWPDAPAEVIHVVSPNGEYLGITLPPIVILYIGHGQILGYIRDNETEELVPTAYRIQSNVRGLEYPN